MDFGRILQTIFTGCITGGIYALVAVGLNLIYGTMRLLNIAHGEVIMIRTNGAGKTTLFNLISGVYSPSSGSIRFNGQEITGLKTHDICRKGLVRTFQIVRPFSNMTVLQLEHLDLTSIGEINLAFEKWLQDYNFNHSHTGIHRQCPADLYTPSLRKVTSEQLEFILVHEEPRKVLKTGMLSYYGHYYRVRIGILIIAGYGLS